jgi:gamma-glutamylputrescine oxidase
MSPPSVDQSIWSLDAGPATTPLDGSCEVETLIVGGGISGLTLAYTLAQQGGSVALLEAKGLAGAASGRNAGFLLAAPAEPYGEAVALWGREGARAVLETGRRTHQRIRELVESLGIDCQYQRAGSMRLARNEDEAEDHRASLPLMRADGFPVLEVPPMRALPGGAHDHFVAAFFTEEDGELHPVRFLNGLARAALALGAKLFTRSEMAGAHWSNGAWEARSAGGTVRARSLVLATNAEAPRLVPSLGALIAPRRGQMLATAPIPRLVAPYPTYAHWGYQYWRQTPDGRLVIGGWRDLDLDGEVGFDVTPTPHIQKAIEGGLAELVPEGAAIERRWAGTMGFSRDGRPLVGWLDAEHHLAVCAGFTGHGMGMAAACTLDLARLLSFRPAPGIATYDPLRFAELRHTARGITALGAAVG